MNTIAPAPFRIALMGLLFCAHLQAQDYKNAYQVQQSNALPMMQTSNCFEPLLERGRAALDSGNCPLALRLFRQARECPEVEKNIYFRSIVDEAIDHCMENVKGEKNVIAQESADIPTAATEGRPSSSQGSLNSPQSLKPTGSKGRYKPTRAFQEYDDPNCFAMTKREADRAFALGFWEDAASLYRAAKSCADADQNERQAMNDRIEFCRLAAQNELLQKEQEAVFQARQARASNRAYDAQTLLKAGDRTLAYRLADFANTYIAPPGNDNPDCLQAMYDAWFFAPAKLEGGLFQPPTPLCYQLAEDLGESLQLQFAGSGARERLWAFSPERHKVYSWVMPTMEPDKQIDVDTAFRSMEVSPKGNYLLFHTQNGFVIMRGLNETYPVNTWQQTIGHFDENEQYYYYYDALQGSIVSIRLDEWSAPKKGAQTKRSYAAVLQIGGIKPGLLLFRMVENNKCWLVYEDQALLLHKNGDKWATQQNWAILQKPPGFYDGSPCRAQFNPERQQLVLASDTAAVWYVFRSDSSGTTPVSGVYKGQCTGISDQTEIVGMLHLRGVTDLWLQLEIYGTGLPVPLFIARTPETDNLTGTFGAFSSGNRWFALASDQGALRLWLLDSDNNTHVSALKETYAFNLSPDGTRLAVWTTDTIAVYPADAPLRPIFAMPLPADNAPALICGNQWLAYRHSFDSVGVLNWTSGRRFVFPSQPGLLVDPTLVFDEPGNRVALISSIDTVQIRSLKTGEILQKRHFDGEIRHLAFFPNTGELLVVQAFTTGLSGTVQNIPKIWNPADPLAAPSVIRLQNADVTAVAIGPKGDLIAFDVGNSVRIFNKNNLQDEVVQIRPIGDLIINAIAFHPTDNSIAVGYIDKRIIFWDLATGRIRFKLLPTTGGETSFPVDLRFLKNGAALRLGYSDNVIVDYVLSPNEIREIAQDEYRKMQTFTPSQIRDFELEQAFEYPGNFEHLAQSGDLPLIRSFFDYYRQQAINSNDIGRISENCSRALQLFDQLDPAAQTALQPTLLEMYEDYNWELLLRQKMEEAEKTSALLLRNFENSRTGMLMAAHTALLKNELPKAASLYSEWALSTDIVQGDPENKLDNLSLKFRQLAEYGLLAPAQAACICTLFDSLMALGNLCDHPAANFQLDPDSRLRQSVLFGLFSSNKESSRFKRTAMLRQTLAGAERLHAKFPNRFDELPEIARLQLAEAYRDWSEQETRTPEEKTYLQEAIQVLNRAESFHYFEPERLNALGHLYLALGNAWAYSKTPANALQSYSSGLSTANQLLNGCRSSDDKERVRNGLIGPMLLQTGIVYLLENNAPLARNAFTTANDAFTYGIDSIYWAHLALVEGRQEEALQFYLNIGSEDQLGYCLAFIERMAAGIPNPSGDFYKTAQHIRQAFPRNNTKTDPDAVQFYYATERTQLARSWSDWNQARIWSDTALHCAERMMNKNRQPFDWRENWLGAQISHAFYLLLDQNNYPDALDAVIRYSEAVDAYLLRDYPYYTYRNYVKTNLAHAYWARNEEGDRDHAVELYMEFLDSGFDDAIGFSSYDPWEILYKDFRELNRAGHPLPQLPELLRRIAPNHALQPQQWREIGVPNPPGQ